MRGFVIFFLGFLTFSPNAFAEDDADCSEDPRACFEFDEEENVKTKSGKAERTYAFPPIKAGFIFDFNHRDLLPHLSVEVVDFDVPYVGDLTWDVGLATSRAFTSLTWEVIPIVKAGPSIWVGYNIKENDWAAGIGVSLLNF